MNRCSSTRPGIDDNCAAKPLYPLLHPEEPHPPSAFGLETASIVRDLELNSVAELGQVHQNILRMGMTLGVIQRLLYHSEQTNFHFIRQMFRNVFRVGLDVDVSLSRELPRVPLHGRDQPQFIEHGGPKQ